MSDTRRGSRPGVSHRGAAASTRGRTQEWSAALQSLREASQQCVRISAGRYVAAASACGKGEQWQWALSLLGELVEAKVEPTVILQRWDQRVRDGKAVAAGACAAQRDVGSEGGARRHELQCWDPRLRKGRAVAAGSGVA
ncbi:unnamed protein product [Prorocentrum cordatum]|uniref:Uncharacterized protein n=1 Tax=Prorocentrum cordatum TaxID=2364126 RepID=A0ABN9VK60_9DINO|nr:unnamed protein product [Polarella glacialis]